MKPSKTPLQTIAAHRSVAGPVLIEIRTQKTLSLVLHLTEQEAIALCDDLRRVIEDPTFGNPFGKNVTVMQLK
jgi:hypothetical protein